MKKTMMTLTMMFILATCVFAGNSGVEPEVLKAFANRFNNAQEVLWSTGNSYYRASFIYNGRSLFAYYNTNAELIGIARYVSPIQLPEFLQKNLRRYYSEYWISNLIEVSNDESVNYFITLQYKDEKIILESRDRNNWQIYRKYKNQ